MKRRLLMVAGLAALLVVFYLNSSHIVSFGSIIREVEWRILLLVVVTQAWSYYNNAKYYQSFLAIFDYHIQTKRLVEAALAINFVNQAFPSGGVSGASFLSQYLKGEVPVGKATLAQLLRYLFTFLSFIVVLSLGFLLLFWADNVTRVTVRFVLLLILILIIISLLLVVVIADRERVEQLARFVIRALNRLGSLFRRKRQIITPEQTKRFFDEFYEGYTFLLAKRHHWRRPLWYCLGGNLAEVATVYVVFLAFGQPINPGVVIAGYALANAFSVISIFSSGVGIYEATMVAAFVALGVPFALALPVVIVYRVLNFGLFLPLGFHFYQQRLAQ